MIIMSQGAYDQYVPTLAAGGVLLIDDSLVTLPENHSHASQRITIYGLPATQIAEGMGNNRAANTIMLGFWTAIIGVVSHEAMRQAVAESVPAKTLDLNMKAFDIGYEEGDKQRAASPSAGPSLVEKGSE
jgi:2-oxoglutarate ferredoxin oxidoreductase subunit gamma